MLLVGAIIAILLSILIFNFSDFKCQHSNMTASKILPTCKSEGYTNHVCNKCGYSYVTEITQKSSHCYSPLEIPPTCQSEGYTLYFCACGDFYKSEIIPASEHIFTERTISATCQNAGYVERICTVCAYSQKNANEEKLSHNYISTVRYPTALNDGYTEHTCTCGDSYTDCIISYNEILSSPYVDSTEVLTRGIDVSRWNHQIDAASGEYLPLDWQKIKAAGFDFVIIKAGSTRSGKEPTFELDYRGAKEAGLMVGAYYYTYSSTADGALCDAISLLEYIEGKQFEYPIYFDLEDPSISALDSKTLTTLCETFICTMQESGYYSALYTNNDWLKNRLDTAYVLSTFDIWYARYPQSDAPVWNEEKYGPTLSMWQYTQLGRIDGIEGYFDFNFCYRDYTNIMKKWSLNGFFAS